jgi:hypothetical protein
MVLPIAVLVGIVVESGIESGGLELRSGGLLPFGRRQPVTIEGAGIGV